MSVGRRCLLLPVLFLILATALTSGQAGAQQGSNGSHTIWSDNLTPDQIKAALSRLSFGEGANDPFQQLLRDHIRKKHPEFPPQLVDEAIRQFTNDKQFMERAKQMAKEKQTDPGRMPKIGPEDIAKLVKTPSDPVKMPPGTKGPIDPMPGVPKTVDPMGVEPKVNPKDPGNKQTNPPTNIDPPVPPDAKPAGPPPTKEDELFRPPAEPTDPRSKSLQAFGAMWERNIGPLDQTPEVKRALFDIVSGSNGLDLDLQDEKGNSIWDLLRKGENDSLSFGNFMEGSSGNWKLPKMDFPSFNFGKLGKLGGGSSNSPSSSSSSSSSRPRPSSSGGSGGIGNFSLGGSWFPVIVLGIVVLGILIWMLAKNLRQSAPAYVMVEDGLGPWPVDPRRINTREDVVKAFEYLSVLICGPSAKTWTHGTIADSLADLAASHGETAVMLARLYELARYAPLDEPLSVEELMEARELVCGLAGVSY